MSAEDGAATLSAWQQNLDKDVQEAKSLALRLQGLDCSQEAQDHITKAAKDHILSKPCRSMRSLGGVLGGV